MRPNKITSTLLLALAIQFASSAATIQFIGVNGLSDGVYSVSPYAITVDGRSYQAMCYDAAHEVQIGQTWQANLLTIDNLGSAYYSGQQDFEEKYHKAGWLFSELMKTSDPNSQIGIQHAAWLVFNPNAPSAGAAPWLSAVNEAVQNGYQSVDLSTLRFIESIPGTTQVQGLLIGGFPASHTETPEPSTSTTVLTGCGMLILGMRWKSIRARSVQPPTRRPR